MHLEESIVCSGKEGETHTESEQGTVPGHGELALQQALQDLSSCHGTRKTHADAHARIEPQRKVLAECGFSPLRSKKSQMKKVFISSAKGKQPSNKNPNTKFLLALKDKVVSPSE